jgi:thioredoxin reductase
MFAAGALRAGCGGLLPDAVADGLLASASAGAYVRAAT